MAPHTLHAAAANTGGAETLGQLAHPRPQLESELKQYQRRQVYGRPVKDTSSGASRIIPSGVYDVAFMALRVVVAIINPASATPITHLLRNVLDDVEISTLIWDLCGKSGSKNLWEVHTTTPPRLDPRRGKALRQKIDEARALHAVKLRNEGMVDVDVVYKCSQYQIEPFRSDKELLAARVTSPLRDWRAHWLTLTLGSEIIPHVSFS
ncbi:hypothetical protein LTR08_001841 [Meristemomyces frigidus]|nr:hypothetical protein LTR08_001841 [Meristemomyces frigidus]